MNKIFLLLICLCGLCFGEDSPKCGELLKQVPNFILEYMKNPSYLIENDTKDVCPCVETIICKKETYCITNKCPNYDKPILTFCPCGESEEYGIKNHCVTNKCP
jgi:hypothetical protein